MLDRVERGECVIVTRDGRAVAELRPRHAVAPDLRNSLSAGKGCLVVYPVVLRRDIDTVMEPTL